MKRIFTSVFILIFAMSSMSFAMSPPVSTSSPLTSQQEQGISLKNATPEAVDYYFPQQMYQTAQTFGPVNYEFTKADFATPKWSQLTQSVYVQQTDFNFIITQILVNGAVSQTIILSSQELSEQLKAIDAQNQAIKAEAVSKPEVKYSSNYDSVYLSPVQLLYEASPVDYGKLSALGIDKNYPDLINKVSMSIKVFKRGSYYLIQNWLYPSLLWNTAVETTLAEAETTLNDVVNDNNNALIALGLMKVPTKPKTPVVMTPTVKQPVTKTPAKVNEPEKVIYILVIYKNGTAEIKTFKTQKEATAFINEAVKKYGKNNVKQFADKKSADAALKAVKQKKNK